MVEDLSSAKHHLGIDKALVIFPCLDRLWTKDISLNSCLLPGVSFLRISSFGDLDVREVCLGLVCARAPSVIIFFWCLKSLLHDLGGDS